MGALLSYSIISGFLMLAMYLAYRLFLARDNQHSFNRIILLLIYAVSFLALPVINHMLDSEIGLTSQTLTMEEVSAVAMAVGPISKPIWGTILIWIYMAGVIIVMLKTVITWIRLTDIIRTGKRIEHDGYTLVVTDNDKFAPFSWMHYVVINRSDYDNCPAIVTHELKHVVSHHWIDLLIAQTVCIINWFNPAAWLMRDELMLIHEYQADMEVLDRGHDAQEYQMLLIKKAVGARFPSLANSLNHSKLKKRITMMYKEKSGAGQKYKALALVPMLALALGLTGVPTVRAAVSTISSSEIYAGKDSENQVQDKTTVQCYQVTNINNDGNRTSVVIKGKGFGSNLTVAGGTFTNKGKTYQANSLQCDMSDGTATIIATFPFSSEFKNSSMTLMVNGEEVPFDLTNYFDKSHPVVVEMNANSNTGKQRSTFVLNGTFTPIQEEMTIYLDGKKIDKAEMSRLSSGNIASITVDMQDKAVRITSKK